MRDRSQTFLINVFSEAGKLSAMLAVARRLERRGHEVVFFCGHGDVSARVANAGLAARCLTGAGAAGFVEATDNRSAAFTEKMANPRWAARWLHGVLLTHVPQQVTELSAAIADVQPSVVVTHPMSYAGAIAAAQAKLPWAAVSTGFMGLIPDTSECSARATFALLAKARRALFARHDLALEFRVSDVISPWLNITFATEEVFPRAESGNTYAHLVGPCLPSGGDDDDFPWHELPDDRPIVLVAFGSHLAPKPETYAALIAALSPEEAFFVVVAREPGALPSELPPHVMLTSWVPQLLLLERAAVMVNHGGSNSVMECLSRGRPMLCVPFLYDQHEIARRVAASGVGFAFAQEQLSVGACRAALLALLAPAGALRARAEAVRDSLGDGAELTCELLERLAAGTPIPVAGHRSR